MAASLTVLSTTLCILRSCVCSDSGVLVAPAQTPRQHVHCEEQVGIFLRTILQEHLLDRCTPQWELRRSLPVLVWITSGERSVSNSAVASSELLVRSGPGAPAERASSSRPTRQAWYLGDCKLDAQQTCASRNSQPTHQQLKALQLHSLPSQQALVGKRNTLVASANFAGALDKQRELLHTIVHHVVQLFPHVLERVMFLHTQFEGSVVLREHTWEWVV